MDEKQESAKLYTLPSPREGQGVGCVGCYRIGRLGKAHGIHGELNFLFDDDVFDRTDADYLVLDLDGILVPFFIEEYRFRSDSNAILKLDGVDTQDRARELTGTDVYFPYALTDDDAPFSLNMLIGFNIIDAADGKNIGTIAAINDQTANILFELENGTLIPANDDLIAHIDKDKRCITVHLPEGLLAL